MRSEACLPAGLLTIALLAACGGPPAASVKQPPDEPEPAASKALSEQANQTALIESEPFADSVYTALHDQDAAVRDTALEQLVLLETEDSAIRLQLLITDPSKDVREDTVDALAESETQLARELLLQASFDPHPAVREAAEDALSRH